MKRKAYPITKDDLAKLPADVQAKVLDVLKAFNECPVSFEYGAYQVGGGMCIRASYGADHKFIGIAYADDHYTPDERNANFEEVFGYKPLGPMRH